MPSLSSVVLGLIAGLVLLVGWASPARAAETTNSEFVIIREGQVVDGDLYAGAVTVRVNGTIDGDLVAAAVEQVIVDGRITGSVTAIAPRVVVSGAIEGSLRIATNDLVVTGSVGGDIVGAGVDFRLGPGSSVAGEVLAWAYRMESLGSVGQRLEATLRTLDLAGSVDGSVDLSVGGLRVVGPLEVGGDLVYRSHRTADGLDNAEVGGTVVQRQPLPPNLRVRALVIFARFLGVIFVATAAVTTVWGWPDRTAAAAYRVGARPVWSWLSGAIVFVSPVLVALVAALVIWWAPPVAGLPLLTLAVPLFFAFLGVLLVVSLVAGVPVSAWLGRRVFKRWGVHGSALAGSLLLGAIWLLPWVGWVVPVVALPLGLGAWLTTARGQEVEPTPSEELVVSDSAESSS